MKITFLVFIAFAYLSNTAKSQDFSWSHKLDPTEFKIFKTKSKIPKQFYKETKLRKRQITSHKSRFNRGCTGSGKRTLCNWIAKSKDQQYVISISFGGRSSYTRMYFVTIENHQCYVKEIRGNFNTPTFEQFCKSQ